MQNRKVKGGVLKSFPPEHILIPLSRKGKKEKEEGGGRANFLAFQFDGEE